MTVTNIGTNRCSKVISGIITATLYNYIAVTSYYQLG